MNEYRVRRARDIAAEMRVPGDLAISQRAVLIAALANGPSELTGFLPAEECLDTIQACRALGAKFEYLSADDPDLQWQPGDGSGPAGPSRLRVTGTAGKLTAPSAVLDCGPSRTMPVLLTGLLAGQPFASRLLVPGGACRDAIRALAAPLQAMGVRLNVSGPDKSGIVGIEPRTPLRAVSGGSPVAGALARDALLLTALFAPGKTTLTDAAAAPDHLERLLRNWQVKTVRTGLTVSIWGGQTPESRDCHIPGDLSCAAPFIVAAAAQAGSSLTLRGVGLNAARAAFLRVLIRMGAQVVEEITDSGSGEPSGTLIIRGAPLQATTIAAAEADAAPDELPVLCVAAALAGGRSVVEHTPANAVRLGHMAANLQLMGVEITRLHAGIEIKGAAGAPLLPGCIPPRGDPHIAMACAAAALFTDGETIIESADCVESRWHGFGAELQRFQSRAISEGIRTPMLQAVPHQRMAKQEGQRPGESRPSSRS